MYVRLNPILHFGIAIVLAVLAAATTAAGPLLVLQTMYGMPPSVALQWSDQSSGPAQGAASTRVEQGV